jgi:hypothetical protein
MDRDEERTKIILPNYFNEQVRETHRRASYSLLAASCAAIAVTLQSVARLAGAGHLH